jgi:hypothetical protein
VSDNLATWWNNSIVTICWQAFYKPVANASCWQVVRFLRVQLGFTIKNVKFYTLSYLTRSSFKKFNYRPSSRNWTCAIPVQRSRPAPGVQVQFLPDGLSLVCNRRHIGWCSKYTWQLSLRDRPSVLWGAWFATGNYKIHILHSLSYWAKDRKLSIIHWVTCLQNKPENVKLTQLFRCKRLNESLKSTKMAPNDS